MTETRIVEGKISKVSHWSTCDKWCLQMWLDGELVIVGHGPITTSFLLAYAQPGRETATWRAEVCNGVASSIVRLSEATP